MRCVGNGAVLRQVHTLFHLGTTAGLTDGQLLERFRAHRSGPAAEAAFAALVERHGPLVLSACRHLIGDTHAADDAFQAVFLVLARKARTLRVDGSLGGWLYGVAHRVAARARADRRRRSHRERDGLDAVAGVASTADGPEAIAARRELRPLIHEELGRLPATYRAPLVLCYLEGLTHEEAAARLAWPVGTVRGRMARARDLLGRRLARRGVTLPAGGIAAAVGRDATAALIPPALIQSTAQAAMASLGAAGGASAAAGLASSAALSLADGVIRIMFMTKLKVAAVGLVTLGTTAGGAGAYLHETTNRARGAGPTASVATAQHLPGSQTEPIAPRDEQLEQARLRLNKLKAEEAEIRKAIEGIEFALAREDLLYVTEMYNKLSRALEEAEYEVAQRRASVDGEGATNPTDEEAQEHLAQLHEHRKQFVEQQQRLRNQIQQFAEQGVSPLPEQRNAFQSYRQRLRQIESEIRDAEATLRALEESHRRSGIETAPDAPEPGDPSVRPPVELTEDQIDRLVEQAFRADPQVAELHRRMAAAREQWAAAQRLSRDRRDPALSKFRREYEARQWQNDQLWARLRPVLRARILARFFELRDQAPPAMPEVGVASPIETEVALIGDLLERAEDSETWAAIRRVIRERIDAERRRIEARRQELRAQQARLDAEAAALEAAIGRMRAFERGDDLPRDEARPEVESQGSPTVDPSPAPAPDSEDRAAPGTLPEADPRAPEDDARPDAAAGRSEW